MRSSGDVGRDGEGCWKARNDTRGLGLGEQKAWRSAESLLGSLLFVIFLIAQLVRLVLSRFSWE